MMTKNPMQLKALLNNKAKAKGIPAQLVLQSYFMERLLYRIANSPYKKNFVLKGGFLISAIVGIGARTTMDIDTTVKGFDLTHENIRKVFTEICNIGVDDDFVLSIDRITDIRDMDNYPGIRLHLIIDYPPIKGWLTVDVTTGDIITPDAIVFSIPTMFDGTSISVLAYSYETILAEKLETVLSRGIANTRPRDFYDIYIFATTQKSNIDIEVLREALAATAAKRRSIPEMAEYKSILEEVRNDSGMADRWSKYRSSYLYVEDILFGDVCECAENLMDEIVESRLPVYQKR
jgi:predicted nucleotidyltransferase component of viral defense system